MWPFSKGDDGGRETIGFDDAVYGEDGNMVCPRCESSMWSLSTLTRRVAYHKRALECDNCGYSAEIEDGVVIHK